ncbi:hypothetical protein JCM19233_4847 [Vibrio astriarenae]|nr:hypothetical protein JCM19233_4847 [Vibrio sp. C7]
MPKKRPDHKENITRAIPKPEGEILSDSIEKAIGINALPALI